MFSNSQYGEPHGWKAGNENTNNVGPKPFDSIWEKDSRIIIGIDIGSTQSGVAVAFLQKGVKQTIHRVTQWPGQALEHQSKVPTLALYDKHGKAIAFGAEVEEMMDDTDDRDSGLAKRFKLHMHPSEMREKYSIKLDPLPNGVALLQIYADFMNYLFKNTEPFFKDRIVDGPTIWEAYKDNITFIIAHPNGWGIREQEFLRRAAVDGGLVTVADSKNRVRFVTEAEASVHYCISHSNISNRLKTGLNFAVCDAGGSTVDTTVYTVTSMSPLLKLAEKRDSACIQAGGLYVDDAVEKYLEDTLTRAGIDPEDIKEYVEEGVKDFEKFPKRLFSDGSDSLKLKLGDKGLTNSEISVRRGVMTVPSPAPKWFFDHCVKAIIKSVDDQIRGINVSHILLVGGFGDSPYLQQQLKERSKAVAEGAIMWNTMTSVFSRAPNWSYGIQGYVRFDSYSSDHRERTTFTTPDGYEKVTGVWCEIVKKGVSLNVDDVCRQSFFRTYSTPKPNLESIEIALYSYAGNDQPKWLRTKNGYWALEAVGNLTIVGKVECQPGTRSFYWYRAPNSVHGDEVRLIDSPGFGNEATDDRIILEALVRYFAPDPAKPRYDGVNYPGRVTGVIYIHYEGGRFSNQPSQRTIEMLGKIMGQAFLDRVTVLVKSETKIQCDLSNLTTQQSSPIYPLYCNSTKPRTLVYDETHQLTERIFAHYLELNPRLIRLAALDNFVQGEGGDWQYDKIPQHLRDFFPQDVGHRGTIDQLQSRLHEQGSKLKEQQTVIAHKEKEINDLRSSRESEKARSEELKNQLDEKEEEIKGLRNTWDTRHDRLGELQALLAQKGDELKVVQFNHAAEQEEFRKQRLREQFSHGVAISHLKNAIEDQKVEVNRLKSELGNFAALKDANHELELEIIKLRVELQSNEDRLKLEIHEKEEISKLSSERDSEIKEIRDQLRVKDEDLAKLKADNERRGQGHTSVDGAHVQEKESKTTELKTSVNGLRTGIESKEHEMDRLSAELHRTRAEYASLRNHMQLQENIEQVDITTAIGDINRLIEDFGGSLSEHIEKYIEQNCPQKDIQPKDLLGVFGQVGSEQISRIKQDAYVLLEYVVQATICKQLNVHLFEPFHPSIADDQNRNMFIMQLYDQIKYQEPQSVAGRWRRDTFNSISKSPSIKDQDASGDERLHRLITEALSLLMGKLIDIQPQEILKEHNKELRRVIAKAEELNQLLKGSVSFLGDFHPVVFSFGETFHADYMTPIGSKAKKIKHTGTIVITVEMGLIKKSALGRGQKPEEMVLRKAIVLGLPE
ncbi:unnamed protein product [Rhizoctonia solani]|uniref:Uncharacterized protein n=1 Tax=Rhizoctonia solani TaxID=456999 RepID=A0A8H3BJI7_9AGAM|nr:unnamed protein product [Rhizoctonia solani]